MCPAGTEGGKAIRGWEGRRSKVAYVWESEDEDLEEGVDGKCVLELFLAEGTRWGGKEG